MNKIQQILSDLCRAPGISEAALVTRDGLMAASALRDPGREETVAGLTSFLMMTTLRYLRETGMEDFTGFTLHATHGKAMFIDIDGAYLVALMDQFADPGVCRAPIASATAMLRKCSHTAG
ncbi:MAG: hypothetical protein Fur0037_29400 [Planctomycetota bacterium]